MATGKYQKRRDQPAINPDALLLGKIAPQAKDIESAVLGAIMLESHKLHDVFGIIPTPEAFYVPAHQEIYRAIQQLDADKQIVDLLTVTEQLRSNGKLDEIGGAYYLTSLTMNVVSSAHVENHAYIVMEKYLGREVIRIGATATSQAYDESNDVFDVISAAESALNDLSCRVITSEAKSGREAAKEFHKRMIFLQQKGDKLSGVPSGFGDIDVLLDGWQEGALIVIGALPGTGKSALSLNFCINAAMEKYPSLFLSLEMPTYELTRRAVASIGNIQMDELQRGIISNPDNYNSTLRTYESLSIFTDYTPGINFQQVRAQARKMVRAHGIKLLVVDYLQIMSGNKEDGNREQQVSKLAMNLKNLAGELRIPIIVLAQVDKKLETESREPVLGDLRESAGIGQHADIVAFLYRASADPNTPVDRSCIETKLKFVKIRNGNPATIDLFFDGTHQKFHDKDYVFRRNNEPEPFDNPYAGIRPISERPSVDFWNEP